MVAADPARGDDDALRLESELSGDDARAFPTARDVARLENIAYDAVDDACALGNLVHAMAKLERHKALRRRFDRAVCERFEHAGPGPPGDVKARHGIAMADCVVAAALGPADDGEKAQASAP